MNSAEYSQESENNVSENLVSNETQPDTIANILSNVVAMDNATQNVTVNAEDASSRKVMNENLIVLYKGLILDTTKMDEIELKYIDNTSIEKDKYVITYYNYENFAYRDATLRNLKPASL